MIRVPFFLLFGFNKGTQNKKGKRALLRNLVSDGPGPQGIEAAGTANASSKVTAMVLKISRRSNHLGWIALGKADQTEAESAHDSSAQCDCHNRLPIVLTTAQL